jgi:hypothetical protein
MFDGGRLASAFYRAILSSRDAYRDSLVAMRANPKQGHHRRQNNTRFQIRRSSEKFPFGKIFFGDRPGAQFVLE